LADAEPNSSETLIESTTRDHRGPESGQTRRPSATTRLEAARPRDRHEILNTRELVKNREPVIDRTLVRFDLEPDDWLEAIATRFGSHNI
jgi:hypothetical protein